MHLPELYAQGTAAPGSAGRWCESGKPPAERVGKKTQSLSAAGVSGSYARATGSGTSGDPEDYWGGVMVDFAKCIRYAHFEYFLLRILNSQNCTLFQKSFG